MLSNYQVLSLEEVDDVEFDLAVAKVVEGTFFLPGKLDWIQSVPLLDGGEEDEKRRRRLLRRTLGRQRKKLFTPVEIIVPNAVDFAVQDGTGTGVLVLGEVLEEESCLRLLGVIPCEVLVTTVGRPRFELWVGKPDLSAAQRARRERVRRTDGP